MTACVHCGRPGADKPGPLCWPCHFTPSIRAQYPDSAASPANTSRSWTAEQDAKLRAGWGKVRSCFLARDIGRSPSAIKQRARILGLDSERYYTDEDKALIRSMYADHTAAEIAQRIHGSPRAALAIYRMASKMGLRKWPSHASETLERVRALHAEGLLDREIAARMSDVFAADDKSRRSVACLRRRLGLPANEEAVLEARRRGVRTQMATLGLDSPTQLRTRAFRLYAIECGWPEDLPPRAVQILNVLAEHGPQTAEALSLAIGARADERNCVTGYRRYLKCSSHSSLIGGHGTYTGLLIAKGLIVNQSRHVAGRGKGKGRLPGLYTLTAAAITLREECLERNQRNPGQAGLHADEPGRRAGADAGPSGDREVGGAAA